jgi:chromosome segregation ATPase
MMYLVKDGYSFATKRGVLQPGDEVAEKDFVSHEAFVKAVSKGKIIVGKPPEQLEKEAAERAKKQQAEIEAAAAKEKGKALDGAKKKKETALAAAEAAKSALASAEKNLETANAARADAEAKIGPMREAAAALARKIPSFDSLRQAFAAAETKLKNAKKPDEKASAEKAVADAKAALVFAEGADNELAAAAGALALAEAELEKAETARTESEAKALSATEAIMLAEAETQEASAELAALEGGK